MDKYLLVKNMTRMSEDYIDSVFEKLDVCLNEISDNHGFVEVYIKGYDDVIADFPYGFFDNENDYTIPSHEKIVLDTLYALKISGRTDIVNKLKDK